MCKMISSVFVPYLLAIYDAITIGKSFFNHFTLFIKECHFITLSIFFDVSIHTNIYPSLVVICYPLSRNITRQD